MNTLSRHHQITATEWLLEMRNNESRDWMLRGYERFKEWMSQESQIIEMMAASGSVTAFKFRMADAWLKTEDGREFAEMVAVQCGWPEDSAVV